MKYALSTTEVDALITPRLRATEGSATVISVPSSCSKAAAAVQAASRVHAERGTCGRDSASTRAGCPRVALDTLPVSRPGSLPARQPACQALCQPLPAPPRSATVPRAVGLK